MMNIKVLSTKKLGPSLVEQAKENGVELIERDFIAVNALNTPEVISTIREFSRKKNLNVAITSANAVEILVCHLPEGPASLTWKIFCLSGRTREALIEAGFDEVNIVRTANNARDLALHILEAGVPGIVFFCGKERRDEMPEMLRKQGIEVRELVLYETIPQPQKINMQLDAVLFFSPSAAKNFFESNALAPSTVVFSIGRTTATEVRQFSNNTLMIADEPTKESVVKKFLSYFREHGDQH